MELQEAKTKFIQAWGSLGTEWGINKTMAQIHGYLLVTNDPKSTDDIMKELMISRGNANMNIRMLMDLGIVYKEAVPGNRKDFFVGEKDMWLVAKKIAGERRRRELEPVLRVLSQVKEAKGKDKNEVKEFKEMVGQISEMASFADTMLGRFENSERSRMMKMMMKVFG